MRIYRSQLLVPDGFQRAETKEALDFVILVPPGKDSTDELYQLIAFAAVELQEEQ